LVEIVLLFLKKDINIKSSEGSANTSGQSAGSVDYQFSINCYSREVVDIISRPSKNGSFGIPKLTRREQQILGLLAKGKTSQVIGQELFLSPLTVDTHRRNLIQKFAVKNVAELIMAANQHKIL
jgi:DNA-binding NarL/FixJ family response regulator